MWLSFGEGSYDFFASRSLLSSSLTMQKQLPRYAAAPSLNKKTVYFFAQYLLKRDAINAKGYN